MDKRYQNIFDKHKNGTLTQAEQEYFQSELVINPSFKEAYHDYLGLVEGIRQFERQKLKAFLETPTKRKVIPLHARKSWFIAAAAAVILLLVMPLYNSMTHQTNLVDKYSLDAADRVMGSEIETGRIHYQTGLQHRKAGELHKALESFSQVVLTEENVSPFFLAKFDMALIYVQLNDNEKAEKILNELISHPKNHFIKDKSKALLKDLAK